MKRTLTDWAPFIGAVLALALFVGYYVLLEMRIGDLTAVRREQGKILWGSSALALDLAMFWCIAISAAAIYQHSSSFKRGHNRVILLSGGFLFILLTPFVNDISGRAGNTLLINIKKSGVLYVDRIINFNNVVAALVVILFVVAVVFVTRGVEESRTELLSERIRWFNLLLYSGGVILAVTVYEVYSLFNWAASLELSELRREELHSFASSMAIGGGIVFSSLLMLIMVPSAIKLNIRLGVLMSEAVDPEMEFDPQKWLIRQRIETSPLRSLASYVALLLPIATGFLTKVFGL